MAKSLLGELILIREDELINFNWGNGSPDPSIPNDDYQVRWTGSINAETPGVYNFRSYTDDGVRLYIDGAPVLDHWNDQSATSRYGSIYLTAGMYECVMEYYENGGDAVAQLYWTPPGGAEALVQPARSSSSGHPGRLCRLAFFLLHNRVGAGVIHPASIGSCH